MISHIALGPNEFVSTCFPMLPGPRCSEEPLEPVMKVPASDLAISLSIKPKEPLVASLFLVAMPFAPSSVLVPSSKARSP